MKMSMDTVAIIVIILAIILASAIWLFDPDRNYDKAVELGDGAYYFNTTSGISIHDVQIFERDHPDTRITDIWRNRHGPGFYITTEATV